MFKSFTRIPLSSVSRSAFVWQPKPITLKTPTKFDFNLRNALTRSIHQNQTPLTKLPPNPILWKNNPKFTMQVTKRGPQSIQIRCATNWPNLGKIYTGLTQKIPNEIISTNYYHRMRRDLPLRYLGFTASIITLIVAAKYASVVLLTTGTAGLVASFVASASTVAILTAIILFLLGVAVIYPSLVIAEMVYIARELERLALEELSENSEVTSALGTPLMIAPAKQSEQIIGGHDSVYARIRFVVEGPNGNAMVSVVGKRHYNGFFRGSTWETKYVKAEQLDENYKKTGKTLYKNEKVAADLSKVQTHQ